MFVFCGVLPHDKRPTWLILADHKTKSNTWASILHGRARSDEALPRDEIEDMRRFSRWAYRLLGLLLLAALSVVNMGAGCEGVSSDYSSQGWDRPDAYQNYYIREGEAALQRHDIIAAQQAYTKAVLDGEADVQATAAVGQAITDLMLLPGISVSRALVKDHLAAERPSYDVQRLLWSSEGMLYWFGQNVRWEDADGYSGVRSAVSELLPWSVGRLSSAESFFGVLDQPFNGFADQSVKIADALATIEANLDVALNAKRFDYFYVPAEVFHDQRMALVINRADVAALRASVSMARASIYFVAAYDHDWSLSKALTSGAWAAAMSDPQDPEHDPRLDSAQRYAAKYMNARLMRKVREPARLVASKEALRGGLGALRRSIELGRAEGQEGTLSWTGAQQDQVTRLDEVLAALEASLDKPTAVPYTEPTVTLSLGAMFEGRVLPQGVDWFVEREEQVNDAQGQPVTQVSVAFNEDALEAFATDALSEPSLFGDAQISFGLSEDGTLDQLPQDVLGPLDDKISRAYEFY